MTREKEIEYLDKIRELQKRLEPKAAESCSACLTYGMNLEENPYSSSEHSCEMYGPKKPASSSEFDEAAASEESSNRNAADMKRRHMSTYGERPLPDYSFIEGAEWQHARDAEEIKNLKLEIERLREIEYKYEELCK